MKRRGYKVPRRNLVVLCFSPNICYTQVKGYERAHKEHGLEVDLKEGTWTWNHNTYHIGEARPLNHKEGVIGVYNRASTQQLDSMVHKAREATQSPGSCFDDD